MLEKGQIWFLASKRPNLATLLNPLVPDATVSAKIAHFLYKSNN